MRTAQTLAERSLVQACAGTVKARVQEWWPDVVDPHDLRVQVKGLPEGVSLLAHAVASRLEGPRTNNGQVIEALLQRSKAWSPVDRALVGLWTKLCVPRATNPSHPGKTTALKKTHNRVLERVKAAGEPEPGVWAEVLTVWSCLATPDQLHGACRAVLLDGLDRERPTLTLDVVRAQTRFWQAWKPDDAFASGADPLRWAGLLARAWLQAGPVELADWVAWGSLLPTASRTWGMDAAIDMWCRNASPEAVAQTQADPSFQAAWGDWNTDEPAAAAAFQARLLALATTRTAATPSRSMRL